MRKKLIGLVFTVCLMCSACTAKNQSEQPQSSDLNQAKQLEIHGYRHRQYPRCDPVPENPEFHQLLTVKE